MTLSLAQVTVDCHNALQLAQFWAAAFDVALDTEPAPSEFVACLQSDDREADVERLVGIGATRIHDKDEWGVRWTTLADPEGNEFCVATH